MFDTVIEGIFSNATDITLGGFLIGVGSALVLGIAMAFMYVSIPLGIAYLIISTLIMISRVLAGVHFISDVIAGMAISLLYGYFSFFII